MPNKQHMPHEGSVRGDKKIGGLRRAAADNMRKLMDQKR